ncbi:O-acetyl-ADP-ribose deacetylase [Propionicimonas sp.]|uniref:O-acetyl-ADP-ribose deacetylase n=1 Tax=Propionicimonas sp. TaxID=1955623 RepID=UPI0039E6DEFD
MSIDAILGDLTLEPADALVNAANSTLLGGGGVDGALHAAAGPGLLAACRRVRRTTWPDGLPVGEAVATEAGELPARWVIHTVGPNRNRGQSEEGLLASCYTRSLDIAQELGARTIAFPAVGAGAYGWDAATAARVAVAAVAGHPRIGIGRVRFVLLNQPLLSAFGAEIDSLTA